MDQQPHGRAATASRAAPAIEEYWACDPPGHPSGDPDRYGEWSDDAIQSHYLDQVGEDTLCLCGHDAGRHGWLRGTANSICLDCYHGTYHGVPEGCARFDASPYSCPICNAGLLSVDEAIACCICLACGHRYASHRHKRPNSIVKENGPCGERWCQCPGFGGVRAPEPKFLVLGA